MTSNGASRQEPLMSTYCKSCDHDSTKSTPRSLYDPPVIAIVGMALRLPGGVTSPESFWEFLLNKKNGHCKVPDSRYNVESFYNESKPHFVKTKHGYFLQNDPASFDAPFFGISPAEAGYMDPQQRQLLEVVWECLESAGETQWRGKDIGCYVGVFGEDWIDIANRDQLSVDRYRAFAAGNFALSSRVSYQFDFQGPSMTLETGCSAALVGLHEACQALSSGECSSAIVAGTNLIFTPTMSTTMSDNMVLSPDGTCKTFDEHADGYGRGEAINAIYIKRLDDAIKNNDPIRAVIRSTSTNSDGKTPLISNPKVEAQDKLIRQAYRKACVDDISQTAFFECHGTGTTVGDSVETSVVARLFQSKGVFIGSVKPNVGHSEGASGITSIIKAALALEHSTIPPNVFFSTPSSKIPFKESNLQVPIEPTSWPENRSERVSVNSFGIGGANAHAVLDSARSFCGKTKNPVQTPIDSSQLLVVSANNADSLQDRIRAIIQYAIQHPSSLHDMVYTLGSRREHLTHRAFAIVQPDRQIDESAFQSGQAKGPQTVFVFTGQGAQWAGMGRDLMQTFPTFRADIQMLDEELQGLDDAPRWLLRDELRNDDNSRIGDAELSQPLCTALQIGLVNLLRAMGITASSVVGHSSGEIAAAYAAGAITAKSAIIIAYYRGQLARLIEKGKGSMEAVGLGREEVSSYLEDGVVVACENSPKSVTLSGDRDGIDRVITRLKDELPDVLCRRLRVPVAYHSHHMRDIGQAYESSIAKYIEAKDTMLPLFSTVTSDTITDPKDLCAKYWRKNLESPVLFSTAVQRILEQTEGKFAFIEIGPHSALSAPLRQIFNAKSAKSAPSYIPTMTRNDHNSRAQVLFTLGSAHNIGIPVDFAAVNGHGATLADLPRYPWQHKERYWYESRLSHDWRHQKCVHHELLGSRVIESPDSEPSWRNLLGLEDATWLSDHIVQGNVTFPAAGYIAMAGEAIQQLDPNIDSYSVQDLILMTPLILSDSQRTEIITTLKPVKYTDLVDSQRFAFTIYSYDGTCWTKHSQGQVSGKGVFEPTFTEGKELSRSVDAERWYRMLNKHGLQYGPRFRRLRDITADPMEYIASAVISHEQDTSSSRYMIHPTVIDQCLQLVSVACVKGVDRSVDRMAIPAAIGRINIRRSESQMRASARALNWTKNNQSVEVMLMGETGPLLLLDKATFFPLDISNDSDFLRNTLGSKTEWVPDIDLLPPQDSLPPLNTPIEHCYQVDDASRLALLYILETAEEVTGCEPATPALAKWRDWIMSQASRIKNGDMPMVPEAKTWALKDSAYRRDLIRTIVAPYATNDLPFLSAECANPILENTKKLVSGDISPLEILMEDKRVENYYHLTQRVCPGGDFLRLLGTCKPGTRILEIGAGTGSATAVALKHLHSAEGVRLYSNYTFTDISPGFLKGAQETFAQYQNIEYKVLDISRDAEEQGFDLQSFDLVIASNVLHATPKLSLTVKNVYSLLAPNGRLLLHELNPENLMTDYIMTVLPGWWIGQDDGRIDKPYVSPSRWMEELRAAGFGEDMAYVYDKEPPHQINFALVARVAPEPALKGEIVFLTSGQPDDWTRSIATRFCDQGFVVKWGILQDEPTPNQSIISFLEVDGPLLHDLSAENFHLVQQYFTKADKGQLLWVTGSTQISCKDPRFGPTLGFLRVLRHEINLGVTIFETESFDDDAGHALLSVYEKIQCTQHDSIIHPDTEFTFKDGTVHVPRVHWTDTDNLVPKAPEQDGPSRLEIGTLALVNTLKWSQAPETPLQRGQVEVDIQYVGLNFRDIMVAMGVFGSADEFGLEASGIIRAVGPDVDGLRPGDGVIVITSGLFRTRAITDAHNCVKVPGGLALEDVATMGTVYATAIYSLVHVGAVKAGQKVLIHSACGGVGLASIQICKILGAEIFATVGSEEKVQYLMKTFNIPRSRIFNSRTAEFLPDIMRETNGKGVDLVLNSLASELLHASWECVAPFGKMIELGKRDLLTNGILNMKPFVENRAFLGVDMIGVAQHKPELMQELCTQVMGWLQDGKIQPIRPVKIFEAAQIVDAFRYMQQGVHMGKILVKMPDSSNPLSVTAKQSCAFSPDASYLLVGGLGAVGRTMSTWMVENGARHLVYLSPSAGRSTEHQAFLRELEAQGCEAICITGSVANENDVARAISSCQKPLAGTIQLAWCMRDRSLSKMTYEDWTQSHAPKVTGTWNLHHATLQMNLDFFVTLSSISGTCGLATQANYAAANTFLDGFHRYRSQLGLPSSVLVLGVVEEVGSTGQNSGVLQTFRTCSFRLLTDAEIIKGLEVAICQSKQPIPTEMAVSNTCMIGLGDTKPISDPTIRQPWKREARFALYDNMELTATESHQSTNSKLKALLASLERNPAILDSPQAEVEIRRELGDLISEHVVVADGMDEEEKANIAIDSLMAIEIKTWMQRNLNVEITVVDIGKAKTVRGLAALTIERLRVKYATKALDSEE